MRYLRSEAGCVFCLSLCILFFLTGCTVPDSPLTELNLAVADSGNESLSRGLEDKPDTITDATAGQPQLRPVVGDVSEYGYLQSSSGQKKLLPRRKKTAQQLGDTAARRRLSVRYDSGKYLRDGIWG